MAAIQKSVSHRWITLLHVAPSHLSVLVKHVLQFAGSRAAGQTADKQLVLILAAHFSDSTQLAVQSRGEVGVVTRCALAQI